MGVKETPVSDLHAWEHTHGRQGPVYAGVCAHVFMRAKDRDTERQGFFRITGVWGGNKQAEKKLRRQITERGPWNKGP